jgi:hypothetical protein
LLLFAPSALGTHFDDEAVDEFDAALRQQAASAHTLVDFSGDAVEPLDGGGHAWIMPRSRRPYISQLRLASLSEPVASWLGAEVLS